MTYKEKAIGNAPVLIGIVSYQVSASAMGEETFMTHIISVTAADGRWQMADGRWQMADGRWQMADGRWLFHDLIHKKLLEPGYEKLLELYEDLIRFPVQDEQ